MRKMFFGAHKKIIFLSTALFIGGCGSDKKKAVNDEPEDPDYTSLYKGGQVTFSKEEGDKNFVLMPFQLGDLTKIEGGSDEKFTFKAQKQAASGLVGGSGVGSISRLVARQRLMTPAEVDHNLRTLLNRFDSSKGMNQGAWFWRLTRELDSTLRSQSEGATDKFLVEDQNAGDVEAFYRRAAWKKVALESRPRPFNLTNNGCPTTNVIVPDVGSPAETDEAVIPAGGVVNDAEFCIVYLSDPKTEPSKDKISASVKQILKIYKTVVYKDTFPQAADGYQFKPILVVVDFGDSEKWPQIDSYQVSGVFLSEPSKIQKQPILYMASDSSRIKKNRGGVLDPSLENRKWHGTLAHELQHAILDYYRAHRSKGLSELPAIDEGLAHYMEDLFGYGEENFADWAKAFLDLWVDTNLPVLHASSSDKFARGGGWLLWYYLISQKGGVTFADGVVSGGDGLNFVRAVAQNASQRGPAGLAAKFGKDWTETVADFLGAVVVDGSSVPVKPKKFLVQEPQPVVDLTGNANKKYGMHFNNFGGLAPIRTFSDRMFKSGAALDEVTYYATAPVRLDGPVEGDSIKFQSSSDAPNFAVVKVRLN
jgi:hypothetical protein